MNNVRPTANIPLLSGILLAFISANVTVYGPTSRVVAYSAALLVLTSWQFLSPGFAASIKFTPRRWVTNYVLAFISIFLAGIIPLMAALSVDRAGYQVLERLPVGRAGQVVVSIIVLDFVFYATHIPFHKIKMLWKSHRVHHSDRGFDVTLVGRDHPVTAIGLGIARGLVVLVLAIPLEGLLIYFIATGIVGSFCHSNIRISEKWDKWLNKIFVTPRMHYLHHSDKVQQTDSNYGIVFSFWDKIFGTYTNPYTAKLDDVTIGLDNIREEETLTILRQLKMPLRD